MDRKDIIVENSTTLTKSLMEVYNDLRAGRITPKEANVLANVAGKVIKNEALNVMRQQQTGQIEPLAHRGFLSCVLQLV